MAFCYTPEGHSEYFRQKLILSHVLYTTRSIHHILNWNKLNLYAKLSYILLTLQEAGCLIFVLRILYNKFVLRLYQVGNTSSRKITKFKQLGPQLALGWVTIQGLDVDAVAYKYCKIPEAVKRPFIICLWGKKYIFVNSLCITYFYWFAPSRTYFCILKEILSKM